MIALAQKFVSLDDAILTTFDKDRTTFREIEAEADRQKDTKHLRDQYYKTDFAITQLP